MGPGRETPAEGELNWGVEKTRCNMGGDSEFVHVRVVLRGCRKNGSWEESFLGLRGFKNKRVKTSEDQFWSSGGGQDSWDEADASQCEIRSMCGKRVPGG